MSSSRNHLSSFCFIESLRVRSASQYRGFWFPSRSISFDCLKSLVSRLVFDSTLASSFIEERPAFLLSLMVYGRFFVTSPRPLTVAMVKRASAPSAASSLRSSVVLSRAVEKNFALEAEVSRLRHHVSILSRRLHRNEKELSALRAPKSAPTPTDPPSSPTSTVVTVLGGVLDPDSPRDR